MYISSNMRSNLLCLILFFWKPGIVILNGWGRYERKRALRMAFIFLSRIGAKKTLIAQNRRDYRYLKRFGVNVEWIPGSGGTRYKRGSEKAVLLVTRDSKFECVKESVIGFYDTFKLPLLVVGCKNRLPLGESVTYAHAGYVDDISKVYIRSESFIQPDGYGEGIAHSLVDAICSGHRIYMPKAVYVRTGIAYLVRKKALHSRVQCLDDWVVLPTFITEKMLSEFCLKKVNQSYLQTLEVFFGGLDER
ncbi:hypothetical protein [Teredinibacter turnerae]|uniref:hypothetical protein n=1 Tax=Teredinibacter turnerae TaxID=2426 RepID=UPI000567DD4B|nr:hypothetical protein [Teredinibacter turnerae]